MLLSLQDIPIPKDLPAWALLAVALGFAIIAGVRLAIANYFAQEKTKFALHIKAATNDLETQKERNKQALAIEFERQKAEIESNRANEQLIASAMQQVTRFAESIQSINVMMFEEQAKASRERANLTAMVIEQRNQVIEAIESVNELRTTITGFSDKLNQHSIESDQRSTLVMTYVQNIQTQLNAIHDSVAQYTQKGIEGDKKAAEDTTPHDVQ